MRKGAAFVSEVGRGPKHGVIARYVWSSRHALFLSAICMSVRREVSRPFHTPAICGYNGVENRCRLLPSGSRRELGVSLTCKIIVGPRFSDHTGVDKRRVLTREGTAW